MPRTAPVLLAVALTASLTACGSSSATPGLAEQAQQAGSAAPAPSPSPSCTPLPLERRAAATLVVGLPGVTAATDPLATAVADLGVGGIFLSEPNVETAEQVRALVDGLRTRAGQPLVISTDEESGRVAVTREIVGAGPSPRRLAARTPEQVREFAAGLGAQLADAGVTLDLAPLLDLDDGPSRGLVGDRSFSADPETAATYGLAFSRGLTDAGVTPTVKHFPGQGRSAIDVHVTEAAPVTATLQELETTDLLPFQRAIDAGVPVIMLNHLGYTALDADLPATLSPKAYALLREMGFEGVAMTDSVGMGAVNLRWDFPEAAVRAVAAGADAVLATDGNQAQRMRDALVEAVESGRLPEQRLDEAAARVTALAGGDPETMTCTAVRLPALTETAAGGQPSARPTASSAP